MSYSSQGCNSHRAMEDIMYKNLILVPPCLHFQVDFLIKICLNTLTVRLPKSRREKRIAHQNAATLIWVAFFCVLTAILSSMSGLMCFFAHVPEFCLVRHAPSIRRSDIPHRVTVSRGGHTLELHAACRSHVGARSFTSPSEHK